MSPTGWIVFGFAGQAAFFGRLLWQWICSERAGRLVMPMGFVYLSIIGSGILFVYAAQQLDPVFMAGQGVGFVVYIRQLFISLKHRRLCRAHTGATCPHCGLPLESDTVPGTAKETA